MIEGETADYVKRCTSLGSFINLNGSLSDEISTQLLLTNILVA